MRQPRRWPLGGAVLSAALLTGCLLGCSEPTDLAQSNVVLIVVDTLRADHLGAYGHSRPTSPFIDSLARQSLVFDQARANSTFTRESVAALLTGRLPSMSGSRGWYAGPSDNLAGLAELYRRRGYRTGLFTTTPVLAKPRFGIGFDEIDHLVREWAVSGMSRQLTDRALEFASANSDPFMMYLHYLDPHAPYEPPPEIQLQFTDEIHPEPVRLYTELRGALPSYRRQGFGPGEERYEDMLVRYDAEIAEVDRAIEALFEGLERAGELDRTVVVLTADHGEEFLEHGWVDHAWTLYDEVLRVPLLLWAPGRIEPGRVASPVSLVDLLPTLAEIMRLPLGDQPSDGTSLLDSSGRLLETSADPRPIYGELLIPHRCVVRAVTLGDWKLIRWHKWRTPADRSRVSSRESQIQARFLDRPFDPWSPVVREELYNLRADPGEKLNLAQSEPVLRAELTELLRDLERRSLALNPAQQGVPNEFGTVDPETLERLKALGYASGN